MDFFIDSDKYIVVIFGSVVAFTTAMTWVEFRRLRRKAQQDPGRDKNSVAGANDQTSKPSVG